MIIDELFIMLGIKGDGSLKKAETQLDKIKKLAGQIGVAFGAGILFRGVSRFIEEQRALGDELDKTSKSLGTNVQDLQSLQHAASIAGVKSGELTGGLLAIQKQARDAALGSQTAILAFSRLGVSVRDSSGGFKSATQLFREATGGLARMGNATERSAVAQQLFGTVGARIALIAEDGTKNFRDLEKEVVRLGGGFSAKATKAAAKLTDTLVRLEIATVSFKAVLAEKILPVLDDLVRGTIETTVSFKNLIQDTYILEAALIVLGGVLLKFLIPMVPAIATVVLFGAVLTGLAIAVEDLIGFFKGSRSVIGDFLQALQDFLRPVNINFEGNPLIQFLKLVDFLLESLRTKINDVFGEDSIVSKIFKAGGAPIKFIKKIFSPENVPQIQIEGSVPEFIRANTALTGFNRGSNVQIANTIVVEGAGDPGAVADAVVQKVQEQNSRDIAAAHAELVPAVAQ
jgi:hypothetical protein